MRLVLKRHRPALKRLFLRYSAMDKSAGAFEHTDTMNLNEFMRMLRDAVLFDNSALTEKAVVSVFEKIQMVRAAACCE